MVPGGSGNCLPLEEKKNLMSDLEKRMVRKETNKNNIVLSSMSNGLV